MKIAMWSGPRNLSTAMMYAFAQRQDCEVVDEPFYAAYLAETGLDHPMRPEILASQPTDPKEVVKQLQNATARLHYQKHMNQHMLPGWDLSWMADMVNVFLIRHPARVIASYSAKRENPTEDDLGFNRQLELFEHVVGLGLEPIVIDSHDIRENPRKSLTALCDALSISFDPAMLHWPTGGNKADGIWAAHWYGAVWKSSGFAGKEGPLPTLTNKEQGMLDRAMPSYEKLKTLAL